MDYREYCAVIRRNFTPHNRRLYAVHADMFVSTLIEALHAKSPDALKKVGIEVHPGVFTFDMLQPEFCCDLLEEIAWFENWCASNGILPIRPNTMNNYGTVLDTFGFAPFLQHLMNEYVSPFAARLFPEVGGDSLDTHHGFVVEYQPGKDVSLDFHVDASDVTLNVCLGKEFEGGDLYFGGVRCPSCQTTSPLPGEEYAFAHRVGFAVLHRGRHRHSAKPIISGQRCNLILWCNSSHFEKECDEASCPAWCGMHGVSEPNVQQAASGGKKPASPS